MPAQDKAVGCMQDHQQCYGCLKPQVIHLDSIKGEFSFVCCQTCDLVWIEPMPSADELTEFYDGYHKTAQYTRKLRSKIRRAKNRIFWTNFWRKSGTFLDVGCNVGFAVEAARRLGFDATGIDVDSQTITMAQQFAPNIRVNAIGPGPTMVNKRQAKEDFTAQVEALPLKRVVSVEEIYSTACFLADNPCITGQIVHVDSGQHLAWETPDVLNANE